MDMDTNVLLHIIHVHLQIFLYGNLPKLVQVFFNLLPHLIPALGFDELSNWRDIMWFYHEIHIIL